MIITVIIIIIIGLTSRRLTRDLVVAAYRKAWKRGGANRASAADGNDGVIATRDRYRICRFRKNISVDGMNRARAHCCLYYTYIVMIRRDPPFVTTARARGPAITVRFYSKKIKLYMQKKIKATLCHGDDDGLTGEDVFRSRDKKKKIRELTASV